MEKILPIQSNNSPSPDWKMKAFWVVENLAGFGIRFAPFPAQGLSGFWMKINQ